METLIVTLTMFLASLNLIDADSNQQQPLQETQKEVQQHEGEPESDKDAVDVINE